MMFQVRIKHNRPKKVSLDFATQYMIDSVIPWLKIGQDDEDFISNLSPKIVQQALNKFYNEGDIINSDVLHIYMYGWESSSVGDTEPRTEILELIVNYMRDNNLVEMVELFDLGDILSQSMEQLIQEIHKYTTKKYKTLGGGGVRLNYINFLNNNDLLNEQTTTDLKNVYTNKKLFKQLLQDTSSSEFKEKYLKLQ